MRTDALDETCRRGVAEGAFPGAVVLVGQRERVLCHRAYGYRSLVPERLPMTPDTVFDLSSLTKPLATATAMMLLVRDGRVRLDDPVGAVVPEFGRGAKAAVTFRHLLNHSSGLPAWKPYYAEAAREDESVECVAGGERKRRCYRRVHDEELTAPPGRKALYSDLGFILLGEAVERLAGEALDRFCDRAVFAPMKLSATFFVDLDRSSGEPRTSPGRPVAATEECGWRGKVLCGEVHDDNAFAMGGVAGHAGLFSSAPDVHRFLGFLGRCRRGAEPGFLPPAVVREFLEADRRPAGQTHVLGWDTPSPAGSAAGRGFSSRTVGHLGFTGVSLWWDLERDVHVVFLTNRVHPSRDNEAIREFRPLAHDAVMEGLSA